MSTDLDLAGGFTTAVATIGFGALDLGREGIALAVLSFVLKATSAEITLSSSAANPTIAVMETKFPMSLRLVTFALLTTLSRAKLSITMGRQMRTDSGYRRLTDNENELNLTSVQDVYYHGPATIGNTTFSLIYDTGSSLVWVPSIDCTDCGKSAVYSSELNTTTDSFEIKYGSGKVAGQLVVDSINISNAYLPSFTLGAADMVGFPEYDSEDYHGIVGLGWPSLTAQYNVTPLVPALKKAGQINQSIFSIFLTKGGGELTIGETDPDLYIGNITWLFITQKAWWTLSLVRGHVGGVAVFSSNEQVIVDSGTSLILGPATKVKAMVIGIEAMSGVRIRMVGDHYEFACASAKRLSNITFTLQGADGDKQEFTLSGESLSVGVTRGDNCLFGMQPLSDSPPSWILGDPFLRAFYTVYDYENARLGFAVSSGTHSTVLSTSGANDISQIVSVTNILFFTVLSLLVL